MAARLCVFAPSIRRRRGAPQYGIMVKQWLVGMLAAAIVVGTVALVRYLIDVMRRVRARTP